MKDITKGDISLIIKILTRSINKITPQNINQQKEHDKIKEILGKLGK